jgi:hypothetical protein
MSVTPPKQPKLHLTDDATSQIQQPQMQTDEQEHTTEICQAAERMDTTEKEHAELITPHASGKMKRKTQTETNIQ